MRRVLALAFLNVAAIGCGARPYVNAHIESVNAEYRQLEDYVYALEAENARLQQEVDAMKTTGAASATPGTLTVPSRSGTPKRPPVMPAPRSSAPAGNRSEGVDSPSIELPGSPGSSGSGGGSPRSTQRLIEGGESTAPGDTPPRIELPPLLEVPSGPKSNETLPAVPGPREIQHPSTPETAKLTDKKVTHLFLNPGLTGATDFDGRPGDDGLRVVLEPRNAEEGLVSEAGAVSIVVLNPDLEGDAARVARWDFDQSAVRQLLAGSSPARGIKLEVPWPASAPAANRLKLYVRYETTDGRRVQADREIFVSPPGQAIGRWTPRTAERAGAGEVATASASSAEASGAVRSASAERPAKPAWSATR